MSGYIKGGTVMLDTLPSIISYGTAVGRMEGDGPLGSCFDYVSEDSSFGENTWEKAESRLQQHAFEQALLRGSIAESDISFVFAGDLLNQCTGSAYSMRNSGVRFVGLYGACSTMAESLGMAAIFSDNNIGTYNAAITSSHFCSAERQFRFPETYGGQRTPTAQWTATASGCAIVGQHADQPYIRSVTVGTIIDMGIKDANNMGAAMAPAAYDTIKTHFANTGTTVADYDLILTGDLGYVGSEILRDLFMQDGIVLGDNYNDCGLMLFDRDKQDVHAGGSGCGCSASVLCGDILERIKKGELRNVLFTATGALMSPTLVQQGESIPGIAHSVHICTQAEQGG
ncbi:MAG: stage V sporulation protein AD [Ruminiclostridium sp.]|nr:stage V sporulation protein AD [Ruminiclostridium sp.]